MSGMPGSDEELEADIAGLRICGLSSRSSSSGDWNVPLAAELLEVHWVEC